MDLMGQLSVHLALLLPALMTALDVVDALDLNEHMETLLISTAKDRKRSSIVRSISSKMDRYLHSTTSIVIQRVGLATSILLGLVLGTYTQYSVTMAKQECERKIGSIANCADKKYYFANGFFHPTTCAFDEVEEFNCLTGGRQAMHPDTRILPDAEEEYVKMKKLKFIGVRNHSSLAVAPRGWAKVPNELIIDLSNSKQFSQLPFVICAFDTNLTKIRIGGTLAGKALNWTGQLRAANVTNRKQNYLNMACREELEGLPDFTSLMLGDNDLKDEDLKDGGRLSLPSFKRLTKLGLENNKITNVAVSITETVYRPIVERFVDENERDSSSEEVSISFAGNPLISFEVRAAKRGTNKEWANVLCTCTSIESHILIHACFFNYKDLMKMGAVVSNFNIHDLDLRNNEFGEGGAKAIAAAFSSTKVTTLELEGNQIGDEGAKSLAAALPSLKLTFFGLNNNQIGDEGAKALASALPSSEVTFLDLHSNQIGDEGAKSLAAALPSLKLIILGLNKNQIGDEGAKALASALPSSEVTTLELEGNQIGDEGAKALAAALPSSKVYHLALGTNRIGVEGAKALATALPIANVTTLDLHNNQIGDEGAKALATALPIANVTTLDLHNNQIGDEGAKALAAALPKSKLGKVFLGNNQIGAEVGATLKQLITNRDGIPIAIHL
jgi:Ran GTPase-activating protein (RanGAP) involved in mRNA processing and transport